jgi:hypothetical protein
MISWMCLHSGLRGGSLFEELLRTAGAFSSEKILFSG